MAIESTWLVQNYAHCICYVAYQDNALIATQFACSGARVWMSETL